MGITERHIDIAAEKSVQDALQKLDTAITEISENSTDLKVVLAKLEEIKNALKAAEEPVYGFIDHGGIDNPAQKIEYIGKNKDFTPMSMNMDTHAMSYGSWGDFYMIKANRPAMVRSSGAFDYWLNPDNYALKEDGTESDVANVNYDGNAFAWIPKIYKWEYMEGDDRYVLFCQKRLTDDFLPTGFVDMNGRELPGVWIPMFYGWKDANGKMRSLATGSPVNTGDTTDAQNAAIKANGERHVFFGGAVFCTIADLLTMFVKTTNSQEAYGYGNRSGYVNDAAQGYGTIPNGIVGGGRFYGSNDGKSLNKILHSIVLGSQNVWIRDPYFICDHAVMKVSPNYVCDTTGASYQAAGLMMPAQGFVRRLAAVEGYGSLPVKTGATDSTGYCDHMWANPGITAVALRLANCNDGSVGGLFALNCAEVAASSNWASGAAVLLLPPASAAGA